MYAQLCLILRPMGCSLPGSSVHGTLQARLPFPPPEYLPNPGIILKSLVPPTLTGRFFATRAIWEDSNFFKTYFNQRLITLQHCVVFAIHSCEPAMGVHVFPIDFPFITWPTVSNKNIL